MTASMQQDSMLMSKRTRICGPQSKNGCFTCKARRIKCDEEKPTCLRCVRSGRVCDGYRQTDGNIAPAATPLIQKSRADNASSDRRPPIESRPRWALKIGCTQSEQQHRLAQLGIGLLSFDSFGQFGAAGAVLNTLLPQLCLSIPSVNIAATALGAIHEMQLSYSSGFPVDQAFAVSKYQIALQEMRQDLFTQPHGPIPLIMICFIFGIAEILLQQESNALFHLRGASKLLKNRRNASHQARSDATLDTNLFFLEDEIGIILRIADFQTSSYAWSKAPDLPAISIPPILPSITDLSSAHIILIQLVHACYNFTCTAYKFKYQPQSTNPSIYIEQGRYIACVSTWLEQFNLAVLSTLRQDPTSPLQVKTYSHALALRMTALSALIYLSCILSPYETAFNAHASHFQQIVTDGETIVSTRRRESDSYIEGIAGQRFTTGPGLIQPLFLTAFKYRDPPYRRRAIALLSISGREGPWSGPREARITSRIMELEERWSSDSPLVFTHKQPNHSGVPPQPGWNNGEGQMIPSPATSVLAGGVHLDFSTAATNMPETTQTFTRGGSPFSELSERLTESKKRANVVELAESALINGMGMSSESVNGRPSNRVTVRFSKCKDIKTMISYPCGHGPGHDRNLDSHSLGPCPDNPHWEMWEEVLEF